MDTLIMGQGSRPERAGHAWKGAAGRKKSLERRLPRDTGECGGQEETGVVRPPGEQRKFPRFSLQKDIYVCHREIGKIVEIGMGGLVFCYLQTGPTAQDFPGEGILFHYDGLYLEGVPLTTVFDGPAPCPPTGKGVFRRRQLRFGALSADLVSQLERLILANARIPQLAYDSRYRSYATVAGSLYRF